LSQPWLDHLSEHEKRVMTAAGFGGKMGFGERPALIIVDVTYGFTGEKPEPILEAIERWRTSCGEVAWPALANIRRVLDSFRAKRLPVIYTHGGARSDNWDTGAWKWKNTRWQESANPDGGGMTRSVNDIVDEIAPRSSDFVIRKMKPSAFFATNLISMLVQLQCDSVVVVGTSTSGCVRATALDAFNYNLKTAVIDDCCFDRIEVSHAIALFDLNAKYADVVSSPELLAYVDGLPEDLFPNLPG